MHDRLVFWFLFFLFFISHLSRDMGFRRRFMGIIGVVLFHGV
jgi:hypothetical protein